MQLKFKVIIFRAEQIAVVSSVFNGLFALLGGQRLNDLTGDTGGGDDQALVVLGEQFAVNAGAGEDALAHPVEVRPRSQLNKIAVADLIFRQQQQVVVILTALGHRVAARPRGHIGFHAKDGAQTGLPHRVVKLHRPIHHTVVSESDAVHPQFGRTGSNRLGRSVAVEQAVLGVNMQMDKVIHGEKSLHWAGGNSAPTVRKVEIQ